MNHAAAHPRYPPAAASSAAAATASVTLGHGRAHVIQPRSTDWFTVLTRINEMMGVRGRNQRRFPLPMPVSMTRKDIRTLFFGGVEHGILLKSDGHRHGLVFLELHERNVAILFDRALTMFVVPIEAAPEALFRGTLVDGELVVVTTSGRCLFEIFDMYSLNGAETRQLHYVHRLQLATKMVTRWIESLTRIDSAWVRTMATQGATLDEADRAYRRGWTTMTEPTTTVAVPQPMAGGSPILFHVTEPDACFDLVVKPCFALQDLVAVQTVVRTRAVTRTDGLVLPALQLSAQPFQDPHTFKFKEGTDHTVDFLLVRASDPEARDWRLAKRLTGASAKYQMLPHGDDIPPSDDDDNVILFCACSDSISDHVVFHWDLLDRRRWPSDIVAALDGRRQPPIVECRWSRETRQWHPEILRATRPYPNHIYVVERTIENLIEDLQWHELRCDEPMFHPEYVSPFHPPSKTAATTTSTQQQQPPSVEPIYPEIPLRRRKRRVSEMPHGKVGGRRQSGRVE